MSDLWNHCEDKLPQQLAEACYVVARTAEGHWDCSFAIYRDCSFPIYNFFGGTAQNTWPWQTTDGVPLADALEMEYKRDALDGDPPFRCDHFRSYSKMYWTRASNFEDNEAALRNFLHI